MTLKECYDALGGNYEDVLNRFRKESLVEKFVLKFTEDKSFELLCSSINEDNGEEAFRASHTIKGVCQNLSFDSLFKSAYDLTEELRDGVITQKGLTLFENVKTDYLRTIEAIEYYKKQMAEVL